MKLLKNIKLALVVMSLLSLVSYGCKKSFLDENAVTTLTTDTYYKTEAGFEDLVRSCYSLLRNIHQNRALVLNGTDMFTTGDFANPKAAAGTITAGALEHYDVRFNASMGQCRRIEQ
jgi:hypothetical protein